MHGRALFFVLVPYGRKIFLKTLFLGCLWDSSKYCALQRIDLLFYEFSFFALLPTTPPPTSALYWNKSPETHCGLGPRCRPSGNTPKWFNRKGNSYSNGMVPYSFPRIIIKFMSPAKELYWVSQIFLLLSLSLVGTLTFSYVSQLMPQNYSIYKCNNWTDNFNKIQLDFRLHSFLSL